MSDGGSANRTTKNSTGTISMNGTQLATSALGPNGYSTNINLSPDQRNTWNSANSGISSLMNSIGSIANTSPQQHQTYTNELYQPQANQIQSNYTQSKDQAYAQAANLGGLNSLGFNRYNSNILDKNENTALQNAYDTADMQAYQVPNMQISTITSALNDYMGAQNQIFNQGQSLASDSSQAQAASNQYNTANNLFNQNNYNPWTDWQTYAVGVLNPNLYSSGTL